MRDNQNILMVSTLLFASIFFSLSIGVVYGQVWDESYESNPSLNQIPDWVKQVVVWWSEDTISDHEFASGLGFLIKENVISVDTRIILGTTNQEILSTKEIEINVDDNIIIPDWVRNSAKWYVSNQISEKDFQILEGIILFFYLIR